MAEAAFSEDGKYYSAITQDGRLRIWDTETNVLKQEYTPDLHLSSPPSCLQWISVIISASPTKGARRKSLNEPETQCIALGTSSGKILIYSISQAKVETVLEDKNNQIYSKVNSLDWHKKYGLFSCTSDNNVWEWELQTSSVRNKYNINVSSKSKQGNKISAIKIVPHNQTTTAKFLISASWQIRLWRLHNSEATVVKCLGHNAAPRALLFVAGLNKCSWLIEGSQTERLLSFWDVTISDDYLPQQNGGDEITPSKRQRKKSITAPVIPTPTYNFVLEDAPRIIDVNLKIEEGATRLSLAATTRSGVVHYYGHLLNGLSCRGPEEPVDGDFSTMLVPTAMTTSPTITLLQPPKMTSTSIIETSGSTSSSGPRQLSPENINIMNSGRESLSRASTKPVKPSLTIQVTTEDAQPLLLQCVQIPTTGDLLIGYTNGPSLVFEKVIPDLKTKTQVLIRGEAKKKGEKMKQNEEQNEVTYVEPMGGVSRKRVTPGGKVEVSMESRLSNLALDIKSRSKAAVNQNLTKLLVQGLHSKDRGLILTVLQRNDPGVAHSTVSSLPADYIPPLLEQLADMAARKTSQCACVCTWLSAVLRSHSALLLASAHTRHSHHLTLLLAIFTNRRSHLCQLLNLKGRLDLTSSQRLRPLDTEGQTVLQYHDSSSDEEMEVERYQSGSEQSWEDGDSHSHSHSDSD